MSRFSSKLLIPALLSIALPAAAQDDPPFPPAASPTPAAPEAPASTTLELSCSAPAEAKVGTLVALTVKLVNAGEAAVELPKLAEDEQLVSFDVQLDDGKTFVYARITDSPYKQKTDWELGKLEPGASWELQVNLPVLTTGVLGVTAHYGRKPAPELVVQPKHVTAKPIAIKLVPDGDKDEVSVRMRTSYGPIHARLYPREALGTSLHMARLILEGGDVDGQQRTPFFQGLTFHRVVRGFVIQGGCPLGTGMGDPGYSIPAEFGEKGEDGKVRAKLRHVPGKLSMARSGHPNSAGSQFFVCVGVASSLDGQYTVFGEVTRGMDVAYTISEAPADDKDKPLEDVVIEAIELRPVKGTN